MFVDHLSMPAAAKSLRREVLIGLTTVIIIFVLAVAIGMVRNGVPSSASALAESVVPMLLVCAAASVMAYRIIGKRFREFLQIAAEREQFFMGIVDACEQPCSVTAIGKPGDKEWRWLYVNGPVQAAFKKPLGHFLDKFCHNWGANICKTGNCGRECLNCGKPEA